MLAILENEVLVKYNSKTCKHYESLGYEFPRYKDKEGKLRIKKGTTILVKVDDLTSGSNVDVTKICDICDKRIPKQSYATIILNRKNNENGIDKCLECMSSEKAKKLKVTDENNCVAATDPELAKLFWNVEDTFKYTSRSGKKVEFKCLNCGINLGEKMIGNVAKQGISCPVCSDNIPYTEKYIFAILNQLEMKFEYQKSFDNWYDFKSKRYYDFYIEALGCVIEVHGMQHYSGNGFKVYADSARSVQEEQENDAYKKEIALKNGIRSENYVVIDARYSNWRFIRDSVLNSNLHSMIDLSYVNWEKCHEYACKSTVKIVSELWDKYKNVTKIGNDLKIDRVTARQYLKQGSELGWCNYNANYNKKKANPVVQLTLDGKFINEFPSQLDAGKVLGVQSSNIGTACKRNGISYGFKWMYKKDYENKLKATEEELHV